MHRLPLSVRGKGRSEPHAQSCAVHLGSESQYHEEVVRAWRRDAFSVGDASHAFLRSTHSLSDPELCTMLHFIDHDKGKRFC